MINNNGYNNTWPKPAQEIPGSNPCGCTERDLNYIKFAKNILTETEPYFYKSAAWKRVEALEEKCKGQGVDKWVIEIKSMLTMQKKKAYLLL